MTQQAGHSGNINMLANGRLFLRFELKAFYLTPLLRLNLPYIRFVVLEINE